MTYRDLPYQIRMAEHAVVVPIDQQVLVYIDCDPDDCAEDITILASDEKGIAIFREFAAKMAEHYKSLK